MKAEVIGGILIKIEDDEVTLKVRDEMGNEELETYPCDDKELLQDEELIALLLGKMVNASVIDGRIKKLSSA